MCVNEAERLRLSDDATAMPAQPQRSRSAPLRALLGPGMSDEDDEVEEVLSRARTPGADEPASAAKPEPDAEATSAPEHVEEDAEARKSLQS